VPDLPARKKIYRAPTALNGLRHHINAMIGADPQIATAAIWQRQSGTTWPCMRVVNTLGKVTKRFQDAMRMTRLPAPA
jgi:hypothetical protein